MKKFSGQAAAPEPTSPESSGIRAAGAEAESRGPRLSNPARPSDLPPPVDLSATLIDGAEVDSGGGVTVELTLTNLIAGGRGDISLTVMDDDRRLIYESLFSQLGTAAAPQTFGATILYRISMRLPLAPGRYLLSFGYRPLNHEINTPSAEVSLPIRIRAQDRGPRFFGVLNLAPDVVTAQPGPAELDRAARLSRSFAARIPGDIDFGLTAQPLIISGFYPAETSMMGRFRWTMSEAECQLQIVGPKLKFKICSLHPDAQSHPVTVALTLQGMPLQDLVLRGPGTACVDVPAEYHGHVAALRLTVHGTWRPSECFKDNPDQRVLGIALASVESVE